MQLLITNLNRLTTSSQIVALLLPFGLVTSARILMNAQSGRSEGTALVEMEYKAGHVAMQELDDLRFMNYFIRIRESMANSE